MAAKRYIVLSDGERSGPYTVAELAALSRAGRISPKTPLRDMDTREGLSLETLLEQAFPSVTSGLSAAPGDEPEGQD